MIKKLVATHNGGFHADDVFAVAALGLLFKGDIEVVRTRDQEAIEKADIVVDVGFIYDPSKQRFDHHQEGGAGARPNGIPYSSIGLVWREYGSTLCGGSLGVAQKIEQKLIAPLDAHDAGVPISSSLIEGVAPYTVSLLMMAMNPTWKSEKSTDTAFFEAVELAKGILQREIEYFGGAEEAKKAVMDAYTEASDKRVLVLTRDYPTYEVISDLKEVLFVVHPAKDSSNWSVKCAKGEKEFSCRLNLPAEWGGKQGTELQTITGISDAVFCHSKLFVARAGSQEGARALATKAIELQK